MKTMTSLKKSTRQSNYVNENHFYFFHTKHSISLHIVQCAHCRFLVEKKNGGTRKEKRKRKVKSVEMNACWMFDAKNEQEKEGIIMKKRNYFIIVQLYQWWMSNESSKSVTSFIIQKIVCRNSNSKTFSQHFCRSSFAIAHFHFHMTKRNETIHLQKSFIRHNQIIIFITSNAHLIFIHKWLLNCWLSALITLYYLLLHTTISNEMQKKRAHTHTHTANENGHAERWTLMEDWDWDLGLAFGKLKNE